MTSLVQNETMSQSQNSENPSLLIDLHSKDSDCRIPYKACDIRPIKNPLNPNEIILFGGYKRWHIYVYNRITDKFTLNKHDFTTLSGINDVRMKQIFVLPEMTKNTLIVVSSSFGYRHYYSIFNCENYEWIELNGNNTNNKTDDRDPKIQKLKSYI